MYNSFLGNLVKYCAIIKYFLNKKKMVFGLIFRPIPVAILPIIQDLFFLVKNNLTMAELLINIKELRQIIRLKKVGISNKKVADLLHLSRYARCDEIISLSEVVDLSVFFVGQQ